jgi:hypothetical protein
MFVIWNCDRAAPVGSRRFPQRTALRLAGILEALFGAHYTVVRR